MLQLADLYQNNKEVQVECNSQYGEGVAEFFAKATRHFYKEYLGNYPKSILLLFYGTLPMA